jgi:nucleoside-diphosphate-sugar epimerase
VLGGRGFVGSAFVAHAEDFGFRAVVVGRAEWRTHVGTEVDTVICAAGSAKKRLADADPVKDHDESAGIVERALRDFRARNFVLLSTVDVYPDPGVRSQTSEDATIDLELLPTYGRNRRLAELAAQSGHDRWLVLRLAQMVGPKLAKGPLFDVLHGAPRWVSPESSHHYANTATVARLSFDMLARGAMTEVVNLVGRESVTVQTLISLMPEALRDPPQAGNELERYAIDTSKAESLFELPDSLSEAKQFIREELARA